MTSHPLPVGTRILAIAAATQRRLAIYDVTITQHATDNWGRPVYAYSGSKEYFRNGVLRTRKVETATNSKQPFIATSHPVPYSKKFHDTLRGILSTYDSLLRQADEVFLSIFTAMKGRRE